MIRTLRKRHLQVWSLLLVLLPTGIVLSWLVIPNQATVKLLQSPSIAALPVIIKTEELPDYTINLRTNEQRNEWQLEWINRSVLRVPSAVIYEVTDSSAGIAKAKLIGRIETSGRYVFPISHYDPGQVPHFILYDFIHQQIIDHINFKP